MGRGWVVHDHSIEPDRRLRPVLDVLANLDVDEDPGELEVVVHLDGRQALRAWAGSPERDTTEDPLLAVCGSAFKPILALCLLGVVHAAGVNIDSPLADHGLVLHDRRTTARHLLEHTAGLPHVRCVASTPSELADTTAVTDGLRRLAPLWAPGERTAYHAVSYGFLLQAACEAIGGGLLSDLIEKHVLVPAGVSPDAMSLSHRSPTRPSAALTVRGHAPLTWREDGRSLLFRSLYPMDALVAELDHLASSGHPVPGVGVPCTAAALASIYSAVVAPRPGSALPAAVIAAALGEPGRRGFDQVMNQRVTWRAGALVGAGLRRPENSATMVGLPGFGGSIGFGDAGPGIAMGLVSTRLDAGRIVGRDTAVVCGAICDAIAI